jgi:hypothetical protein
VIGQIDFSLIFLSSRLANADAEVVTECLRVSTAALGRFGISDSYPSGVQRRVLSDSLQRCATPFRESALPRT